MNSLQIRVPFQSNLLWSSQLTTLSRFASAAALAAVAIAPQAHAARGARILADGGSVIMRFGGSDASFQGLISVNGSTKVFPDHSTIIGTEYDLGSFAAGTELDGYAPMEQGEKS